MNTALWIVAVLLIVIGVAGTVLPALPGAILVFAGITLAAWGADYVAAAMGAKKAGASKQAVIGAALGTIAGIFTGLIGLVFMPLVGAAVGEFVAQQDLKRAGKVGVATWIGLAIGTIAKVVIVFVMVGVFVAALFL